MRKLFIAIAFLVGGFAASGTAAAATKSCAGNRIIDTKIEQVQADLGRYLGKCVRLRGILANGRLYADRQATLETNDKTADDRRPKRSIVVLRGSEGRPALVEITGRVADCGLANDAAASYQVDHPDEIVMVSGFCHTSMETYFDKPVVRVLSKKPITRLVATEVPPSKWLLVEAPPDLPNRDEAVRTARTFLGAIATRDEPVFRKLPKPMAQDILDTEGSGVKGGTHYGETDEIGHKAAVDRTSVHDLHATILHLMGLDHKRLTYRYNGRDFRLTDVSGELITKILA